jgi:hypothetical protein
LLQTRDFGVQVGKNSCQIHEKILSQSFDVMRQRVVQVTRSCEQSLIFKPSTENLSYYNSRFPRLRLSTLSHDKGRYHQLAYALGRVLLSTASSVSSSRKTLQN